ncbi:TPA: type II secretion system minor pseudopilin GspK [Yersinia enterocolitica]|nr:type II secretion system minor pseudopilin GspK [Yersinia enterocolitica]HDL7833873.1 type II secretion system minor pseudopilin GspK [Yersinia enterocolitica]HDL7874131.1 type II secretion system minor pseudopilin GspK [Yersinia enterocolitica]HDL7887298.1 type II secretion system minor pseudopilin GspK [Yersinia enterocolitica]HDL7895968.1 type II secretion system minor pseudopilin GspK [Yersinia enterocolitica]
MKNNNQRGMALLVVLMITAMMTITAVNMNDHWLRAFNRATSTQFYQQSKWLLLSMESLVQHQQLSPLPIDKIHLGQPWARTAQQISLDGNQVSFSLRDRQTCFNLNGIGQGGVTGKKTEPEPETEEKKKEKEKKKETEEPLAPYSQLVFQHLLLAQGLNAAEAQKITFALADWLDKDDISRITAGSEATLYQTSRPVLIPANRPMLNISEFRVLPGVSQTLFLRLKPLICTLPNQNLRININTLTVAQAPLLAALFLGEMSVEEAQQLIDSRPANGWNNVNDIKPFIAGNNTSFAKAKTAITLTSNYFELLLWLDENQQNNSMRSLFQRDGKVIKVLSRQYGLSD